MQAPAEKHDNKVMAALSYAARGWHVFPVHSINKGRCTCGMAICARPRTGKHPVGKLVPNGLNDATTVRGAILAWWQQAPWANIGIATGVVSGIFVLDIDTGHKGGDDSLAALIARHGKLPNTVESITGSGGRHIYFKHPGGEVRIKNSVSHLGAGLDVRGDGGYVVAPPSLHISGRRYEWEGSSDPSEVAIAGAPAWLLKEITATVRAESVAMGTLDLGAEKLAEIQSALSAISSDDRQTWLDVGMALQSTGAGQQAFDIWDEWSAQSDKYVAEDQVRVWKSFKAGGITLRSLFKLAKEAGWRMNKARVIQMPETEREITPEHCGIDPNADWKAGLIQKVNAKTGEVTYPCRAHNLLLILEHDEAWKGRLRFDEFRQQVVADGDEWTESKTIEMKAWLERYWIDGEVKTATVKEAIITVADRHTFHPVRDWLEGLTWDGTERLPTFFKDFCGTPFTPYSEACARSLFVSAVARIMRPGAKVDTMITLEGEQGIGKSKLVQAIFGAAWHCDIVEAPGALDFYQTLHGKWVGEFSELSAMGRADQNRVKQALTQTQDTYRVSYGHHAKTRPRQFVFIGNTNKGEYLTDETGARRYLPIECREINAEAVAEIREQLWAEAVHRYRAEERWWDIPDAEAEQEARYRVDTWQESIAPWLRGRNKATTKQILEDCLDIEKGKHGPAETTRIGCIMRRLKWKKVRETSGDRDYYYARPSSPGAGQ